MDPPISRYRLTKNPYHVDRVLTFDPQSEVTPPFPVDGFRSLDSEGPLDMFLRERSQASMPAYVLVRGPNGIGRTAAARHILKRYAEIRKARLLITPQIKPNNDPVDVLQRWLGSLWTELLKTSGKLDPELVQSFKTVLQAKQFDQDFKTTFQNLLIQVDREYGSGENPIVFGFCLEEPPERFPVIDVLLGLFWQVNAIVILVVYASTDEDSNSDQKQREESILDPIVDLFVNRLNAAAGWVFPRSKLATADIQLLATKYWESVKPDVECPITPESIAAIGDKSPLPLVGILSVLAEALEERARSAGEGYWPDDLSLRVDKEKLKIIHEAFVAARTYQSRWNRTS